MTKQIILKRAKQDPVFRKRLIAALSGSFGNDIIALRNTFLSKMFQHLRDLLNKNHFSFSYKDIHTRWEYSVSSAEFFGRGSFTFEGDLFNLDVSLNGKSLGPFQITGYDAFSLAEEIFKEMFIFI